MSQTQRILNYLSDGQPHTVAEIHQACGYSRLNSRVADLRKRGFAIYCRSIPGKTGSEGYSYQLERAPGAIPGSVPRAERPHSSGGGSRPSAGRLVQPEPLRLFGEAA